MFVALVILSAFLAVAFVAVGLFKVLNVPQAAETAQRLKLPTTLSRVIGLLELAAAVGLVVGIFWAPLGIAAAIGLILLLVGATITHLRAKDPISAVAPSVVLNVLSIITLILHLS